MSVATLSPENLSPDLWQKGCERLATELPEHQFNTWIRPLAATAADLTPPATAVGGSLYGVIGVQVPTRFKLDWIRAQYAGHIESVLTDLAGRPVRLELSLAPRSDSAHAQAVAGFGGQPLRHAVSALAAVGAAAATQAAVA